MRRYYPFVLSPLRLILIAAVAATIASAQPSLERAVTLAREKRYAEAEKAIAGVTEPSDPARKVAFYRLKAAIDSGLGDAKGAAAEMERALTLAPGDRGLLMATAVAELQSGRLDEALQHARGGGNTAQAQALIADIQEKRGHFVEAAQAYQAAVALAPDQEQYRIALALELVQHQSFEPAITVLQQAMPLFPRSGKIRTLLGVAQYAQGDVANATASLIDAVSVDPRLEPAYAYLAHIVLESSSVPPESVLRPLCGWSAVVCSALKLRMAHAAGDERAQADAIAALRLAPATDAVAKCELGRAYEWMDDLARARQ